MGAISYVHGLRVLRIEDIHCRLEQEAVTDLGSLTQVRSIFTVSAHVLHFLVPDIVSFQYPEGQYIKLTLWVVAVLNCLHWTEAMCMWCS